MGRRNKHTGFVLKRSLQEVLDSDMAHIGAPLMLSGNDMKGGARRAVAVQVAKPTRVMSVRDNIIKIQQEANPVQFLIDVMNGKLFETHFVDDEGNVVTSLEQVALKDRLEVAKYLTNKVLPTLSVSKRMDSEVSPEDAEASRHSIGGGGGRPSFAQLVEMAAVRPAAAPQPPAPPAAPADILDGIEVVVEGEDEREGG